MSRFRSMWQASLNATKKALTWNMEDLVPPSQKYIFNFNSKEDLKRWHLYSDSEYGGMSSASLEINDGGNGLRGVFSGKLSHDVAEGTKWNISRSGFCGMRSKKFDGFIDLDPYDTIALKIKGDGRCYISTIYTENWVNSPGQQEDNSWQAFVFVPKDNWYITKIPLARYLPTWRGNVIDAEMEMNPSRILGMSLSVNAEGGVPGAKSGPDCDVAATIFDFPENMGKFIYPSRGNNPTHENKGVSSIPVDILDTPKQYIFYIDVPGLSKSDIQVTVEGEKTVVIRSNGKRKREDGEEEGCNYIRLERRGPQKIQRKFILPENSNVGAISAKCENGVLTVTVEKLPPPPKPKTVEVAIA